jgi:hypothetical protein
MTSAAKKLDQLFEQVRGLPEVRQQAAIAALEELVSEPYELSDAELAVLLPALADTYAGVNLTDASNAEILNKPWV